MSAGMLRLACTDGRGGAQAWPCSPPAAAADCQDDVSRLLLRFEVPGRLNHLLQWVAPIDDRPVLPRFDELLDEQDVLLRQSKDGKPRFDLDRFDEAFFEVANESSGGGKTDPAFAEALGQMGTPEWGDSTAWQYWVIDCVRRHEGEMGYDRHPMGMTMQFPVPQQTRVNAPLFNSRAEWISPGYDDEVFAGGGHPMAPGSPQSRWLEDPPTADGRKVVITDTDHYAPGRGDPLWAWKSFLRGHHPILMDFGLIGGVNPPDPAARRSLEKTRPSSAPWAPASARHRRRPAPASCT
jgi:hypothetical protein